jgi:hypothetical protein
MPLDLATTNILLGVMAAVSVLESLALVAIVVAGVVISRRVLRVLEGLEERQVAPTVARVNAILDDVKGVTSRVKDETGRIHSLIAWILQLIRGKRRVASSGPPNAM